MLHGRTLLTDDQDVLPQVDDQLHGASGGYVALAMLLLLSATFDNEAVLPQVDGQSHVVHSEEEAMGTRLTIDSLTCLLANEVEAPEPDATMHLLRCHPAFGCARRGPD